MSPATAVAAAALPGGFPAAEGDGYQAPTLEIFNSPDFATFDLFGVTFHINRIVTLMFFGALVVGAFFLLAFRRPQLVPGKLQTAGEVVYDFIRNSLAIDVIGREGVKYAPYLTTLFAFVFVLNFYEILPLAQIPVNSHIAYPIMLSALTWLLFNAVGIRRKGFVGYFREILFPPGVPAVVYILLTPIELVSTLIVRPFTLAVRLFANMFAGHTVLVVFATGATYLFTRDNFSIIFFPVSGLMFVVLTIFELLVIALQAYIFAILTAQYVAGALAEEH